MAKFMRDFTVLYKCPLVASDFEARLIYRSSDFVRSLVWMAPPIDSSVVSDPEDRLDAALGDVVDAEQNHPLDVDDGPAMLQRIPALLRVVLFGRR